MSSLLSHLTSLVGFTPLVSVADSVTQPAVGSADSTGMRAVPAVIWIVRNEASAADVFVPPLMISLMS